MKPPAFDYYAPRTIDEALALLGRAPDDTKLLAGGQSLVPLLNMRLARPAVVIDLNRVDGLAGIELAAGGRLRLGAMVRQRTLEVDPLIRARAPLLAEAAGYIAHLQIRTRGTVGGSLVHGDPAAELPAVLTALEARLNLRRAGGGARSLSAAEFFIGPLVTAAGPDELLVDIEFSPPPAGTGSAFVEVARVHGAFALAGAAALLHLDAAGRIDLARLALCGVEEAPAAPAWLGEMLLGQRPGRELFGRVADRLRASVEPLADLHAGADYRRALAGVLAARALQTAHLRAANGAG